MKTILSHICPLIKYLKFSRCQVFLDSFDVATMLLMPHLFIFSLGTVSTKTLRGVGQALSELSTNFLTLKYSAGLQVFLNEQYEWEHVHSSTSTLKEQRSNFTLYCRPDSRPVILASGQSTDDWTSQVVLCFSIE